MWRDLSDSAKAALFERAGSPLGGALALNWLAWNWRLVAILVFGLGLTMPERLQLLEAEGLLSLSQTLWLPLATGLIAFFAWPVLGYLSYGYVSIFSKKRREVQERAEAGRRLTVSQSLELIRSHSDSLQRQAEQLELERKTRSALAADHKTVLGELEESRRRCEQLSDQSARLALSLQAPEPPKSMTFPRSETEQIATYIRTDQPPISINAGLLWMPSAQDKRFLAWCHSATWLQPYGDALEGDAERSCWADHPSQALSELESSIRQLHLLFATDPMLAAVQELRSQLDGLMQVGNAPGMTADGRVRPSAGR